MEKEFSGEDKGRSGMQKKEESILSKARDVHRRRALFRVEDTLGMHHQGEGGEEDAEADVSWLLTKTRSAAIFPSFSAVAILPKLSGGRTGEAPVPRRRRRKETKKSGGPDVSSSQGNMAVLPKKKS